MVLTLSPTHPPGQPHAPLLSRAFNPTHPWCLQEKQTHPLVQFSKPNAPYGGDDKVMMVAVGVWWQRGCGGSEGGGDVVVVTAGGRRGWVAGGGDGDAHGGAWFDGSGRLGNEKHFWTWPENSPKMFFGGGGRRLAGSGGGCRK
ncbi:hypothetical protein Tco_0308815 [Tanacetum coccineum]